MRHLTPVENGKQRNALRFTADAISADRTTTDDQHQEDVWSTARAWSPDHQVGSHRSIGCRHLRKDHRSTKMKEAANWRLF
jgi:hypothetical protein